MSSTVGGTPRFFPALVAALRFDLSVTGPLRRLSDEDWRELLAFCDLAHLTLPLALESVEGVPEWVRLRVRQNLDDNSERTRKIADTYREIAATFAKAGIEHLVVKGFAQYPDFTSEIDRRMQSDIDLYCPQDSIGAAQEALEGLGYAGDQTLKEYPADHLPQMTRLRDWQWRGNMYDPDMPPAVEVHHCFWNEPATQLPVDGLHDFWERRTTRSHDGLDFPALASIDNLAFNALHVLRDLLRGDWVLLHVFEIASFLHERAEDEVFWQQWRGSHNEGMRSLETISFALAREWFGCRVSSSVEHAIQTLPRSVVHWLRRFSQSPLTGMFAPNKHGVWLHFALVDGARDKLKILRSTLMPLRLPRMGAAAQTATKTRRTRRYWPSQKHARYVFHVVLRSAFHLWMIPSTLLQGLAWWVSCRLSAKTVAHASPAVGLEWGTFSGWQDASIPVDVPHSSQKKA